VKPQSFYNTPAWAQARREALKRANYCCRMCGCSVKGIGRSRVDHIRPVREYPGLALMAANLRVLCPGCDAARHAEKGGAAPDRGCDAQGIPNAVGHHWNKVNAT